MKAAAEALVHMYRVLQQAAGPHTDPKAADDALVAVNFTCNTLEACWEAATDLRYKTYFIKSTGELRVVELQSGWQSFAAVLRQAQQHQQANTEVACQSAVAQAGIPPWHICSR